jgi:hypothetical protein
MDVACPKCHAQHWIDERISTSRTNPNFNICCSDGAVNLPPNRDPPPQMMMWNSNQDYAILFREHARRYNNALAFTSVNYLSDSRVRGHRVVSCGSSCHWPADRASIH